MKIEDGESRIERSRSSILSIDPRFFTGGWRINAMATEWKFELSCRSLQRSYRGAGVGWQVDSFSVPAENRILRYDPLSRAVTDFRKYTNRTKGLAFAPDGLLYGCQSGSRRVVRFNPDGSDIAPCL